MTRLPRLLLPIALLWLASPGHAASKESAPSAETPVPADLQAAVTRAEFLGRQLFLHDRAAWLATDAMLADKRMRPLQDRIGGWITEPSALGVRVVFFSRGDAPVSLYEIDVDEGERLSDAVVDSSRPLTDAQRAQVRARALAQAQDFGGCAPEYNTVALPSTDGFRVYMMPGFTRERVYPLGGYQLYEIDAAGETVLSSRAFTRSCIDLDETRKPDQAAGERGEPVGQLFTHLLDPQPTEIHVFVSLYARQQMMILTTPNRRAWRVVHGTIAAMELPAGAPSDPLSKP